MPRGSRTRSPAFACTQAPSSFRSSMPILDQNEFVLGGMNMNRHKLAGIAVGLERKGGLRHRLREINLSKNIPRLAGISRSVARDAFFESRHAIPRFASQLDATCGTSSVKRASVLQNSLCCLQAHSCKSLRSKIYASLRVAEFHSGELRMFG